MNNNNKMKAPVECSKCGHVFVIGDGVYEGNLCKECADKPLGFMIGGFLPKSYFERGI